MRKRVLNEDRGARKAAELKRRFRAVSQKSLIGGSSSGLRALHQRPVAGLPALAIWALAILAVFLLAGVLS